MKRGGENETETVLCMDVHCNDCDAYAVNGICGRNEHERYNRRNDCDCGRR